jgi:four helix bundle protein
MIRSYRDLEVWQRAMDLVVACYEIANKLPSSELYALSAQLRKAAVSVPSNIAEGHGRSRTKEYLHHLDIAYGSLMEAETQLLLSERVRYTTMDQINEPLSLASEVGRMLNGLIAALKRREDS